jgi:hypothetical protein
MSPTGKRLQYRAILIGSPVFPKCQLPSPSSLRASARGIRNYLEAILGLEEDYELLSLFGSEDAPNLQLEAITEFLKQVRDDLAEDDDLILLVYYLGHGYISKATSAYCLAIRGTTSEFSSSDGIIAKELLSRLKAGAPQRKRILFIDACFAAKAVGDAVTLSVPESLIVSEYSTAQDPWTAIYCAVKGDTLALAPKGSKYTLFSHGVIHALNNGDGTGNTISVETLDVVAWSEIQKRFADLSDIPRPHLFVPDQPRIGKADPVFPVASSSVDEDTLKAVKLILSNELSDLADTIRDAIRPEIEDAIITSVNEKLTLLRTENQEVVGASTAASTAALNSVRSEVIAMIADRVRLEVRRQASENRKTDGAPLGQGISSMVLSWLARSPAKKPSSSTPVRKADVEITNDREPRGYDRGSRLFRLFFTKLYDRPPLTIEDAFQRRNLLYQNMFFVYLMFIFAALSWSVIRYFDDNNIWPIIFSIWFDDRPHAGLSEERFELMKFIFAAFTCAFIGSLFWGFVGLLGYRRTTTNRRYHGYRIFGLPVNPDATTSMFVVSIVCTVVSALTALIVIPRFT